MLKNLAARIVFGAEEYADAREISEELGTIDASRRARSRSRAFDLFEQVAARRAASASASSAGRCCCRRK